MKFIRQFLIIILISFAGELLHAILPLSVPASIYGLLILLAGLQTKVIPLKAVDEAGGFLIEIMPMLFIPAGVGLMVSWGDLKPVLVPIMVTIVVTTVLVMGVSGRTAQFVLKKEEKKESNMLHGSTFFCMAISLFGYEAGIFLRKKLKIGIFNPLLVSIVFVIIVLKVTGIDYDTYDKGANVLSYLLTPSTVCLAIPLYQQMNLLKKNLKAIIAGITTGVFVSLAGVWVFSMLFHLKKQFYVTLLPKSITTAIGMGISEELGGIVTITVAAIVITGIIGNMFAEGICKLCKIEHPIAKGLAIGTASHAMGTAKAMEIGEIEGAMSSLSIAVAGLMTVVGASIFYHLY